jgi:xylulokinase
MLLFYFFSKIYQFREAAPAPNPTRQLFAAPLIGANIDATVIGELGKSLLALHRLAQCSGILSMNYVLGIDLGTSSVKAALFSLDGFELVGFASEKYPVLHPQPGFAEQDPDVWWAAVVGSISTLMAGRDPHQIAGIGIDGQMHGLVCLGSDLTPLQPAIIWADTRSVDLIDDLAAFQRSCKAMLPGPPAAGFAASTALWLSRYDPEILAETHTILAPKDYIRLQLTGEIGTDPSDASATWLYDMATSEWSLEIAELCGLQPSQLPLIKPTSAIAGSVQSQAAEITGLAAGTPVITGSADLAAQATGHGILRSGDVLITVGTGGQVVSPRQSSNPDPLNRFYVFHHTVSSSWYAQAAILSAGLALRWLRDLLGLTESEDAYDQLSTLASEVPAGAEGLLFLPYLAGERTPHMDPNATGLFLGLRLHHHAGHLARAVMEGVGFALKDCLKLIEVENDRGVLSGGAAESSVWSQILADILGLNLLVSKEHKPYACLGSAVLASPAFWDDPQMPKALERANQDTEEIRPGENTEHYKRRYAQYVDLYNKLKKDMHLLSEAA